MKITESMTKLTVPTKFDARFTISPELGRISLSPGRIWWFFLLYGAFLIAFMLLFVWFWPVEADPYLTDPTVSPMRRRLTIAFSASLICGIVTYVVFWFMSVGRETILFSRDYLTIRSNQVARFPVAEIEGVRHVIGKVQPHFDASEGLFNSRVFGKSPTGSVDILTPDGPVRVLNNWKLGTTRWLADAIARVLDKPLVAELNEQDHQRKQSKPLRPVMFTRWELSALGLLVVGVTGFMLISTCRVIYCGSVSKHWPTVEGAVLSHQYTTGYSWMDKKVTADISYTYEINGQTYEADRIWYGFHTKTRAIEALFAGFNKIDRVVIHYDPDYPKRSTLVTGYDSDLHYVVPLLVIFLLLGLGLLIYRPNSTRVAFTHQYFPKRHKLHFWVPPL